MDARNEIDLHDIPTQRRASVALDAIVTARSTHARQHRRPAALTAREALAVLQFESLLIWTAAGNVRNGVVLTDEDFDRLTLAIRNIDTITGEVLS